MAEAFIVHYSGYSLQLSSLFLFYFVFNVLCGLLRSDKRLSVISGQLNGSWFLGNNCEWKQGIEKKYCLKKNGDVFRNKEAKWRGMNCKDEGGKIYNNFVNGKKIQRSGKKNKKKKGR